jgi:hypothetical protein
MVSTKARKRVGCGWPLFSCVEITMPKGPFLPSDFTATKFSTAADKAEFGNTLLVFIESEWAPALFTKRFYNRLSMCFGHIAHYVERENMWSAGVNTPWIKSSTASALCIIPTIEFSAASQLPVGRSLSGTSKIGFQPLDPSLGDFASRGSEIAKFLVGEGSSIRSSSHVNS